MMSNREQCLGRVVEFDVTVGLGVVSADGRDWPFHCVSILDGTRSIEVGATVTFVLDFCTLRREATHIATARH